MENEQTDKTDTEGAKDNPALETPDKPLSLYEKTESIVARQEEANKKTEELLARQETLHANQRLAGTGGGSVETKPKEISNTDYVDEVMGNSNGSE